MDDEGKEDKRERKIERQEVEFEGRKTKGRRKHRKTEIKERDEETGRERKGIERIREKKSVCRR